MILSGVVLVGLSAYAAGQQHTRIPEVVLAQDRVAHLMSEAERALDPIVKDGNDKPSPQAKHNAVAALASLRDAIRDIRETTDRQVDRIVDAAKK
jgi:hypothetical protein